MVVAAQPPELLRQAAETAEPAALEEQLLDPPAVWNSRTPTPR